MSQAPRPVPTAKRDVVPLAQQHSALAPSAVTVCHIAATAPSVSHAEEEPLSCAVVALELALAMPHPRADTLAGAALAASLSCLRPGLTLRLTTLVRSPPSAKERLCLRVTITGRPGTSQGEWRKALSDALRIASPAYKFKVKRTGRVLAEASHGWSLYPRIPAVLSRPMGFAAVSEVTGHASPPVLEQLRHSRTSVAPSLEVLAVPTSTDAVITALLAIGIDASIEHTWTAVDLSDAFDGARNSPGASHDDGALGRWAQDPRGFRTGCRVRASRPIPESLLHAIGALTFGTNSIRVEADEPLRPFEGVLWHLEDPLPVLVPSPSMLLAAGVSRGFPDAPPRLPRVGVRLGTVVEGARSAAVRIPDSERTRHTYVVGATGTGKSTLLLQMLTDDINSGAGVMLVDPHGDLFPAALSAIPPSRADDVVIMDASDREHPFAFNILSAGGMPPRQAATFITNELLAMFDALYDMRVCGGPIFESYFTHAMALLMTTSEEPPTLGDLARVFEEPAFLSRLLERCQDPELVRFWKVTAQRTSGDQSLTNMTSYIVSKVNRITLDATLRPILAPRADPIDLRRLMDEGRIVLVNLGKGSLGSQTSRFLGMALMMRLMAATLGRANVPQRDRKPFYVYVDEFQSLATESAATLLAEARKFGIGLTLASQTLGQLDRQGNGLAEIVTGNVASLIMTRLGPSDAHRLSAYTSPTLSPAELQALPSFRAVGCFLARGVPPPPFVFSISAPRRIATAVVAAGVLVERSQRVWRDARARPQVGNVVRSETARTTVTADGSKADATLDKAA